MAWEEWGPILTTNMPLPPLMTNRTPHRFITFRFKFSPPVHRRTTFPIPLETEKAGHMSTELLERMLACLISLTTLGMNILRLL